MNRGDNYMNEEETRGMIEQAKINIIKMVVGNNNSLCNELLNIFNSRIEIKLGSQSQVENYQLVFLILQILIQHLSMVGMSMFITNYFMLLQK